MLNKNGMMLFRSFLANQAALYFKQRNGSYSQSNTNWMNYLFYQSSWSSSDPTPDSYRRFYVGSGTTEPTVNDYSMENEITNLTLDSLVTTPNNTDLAVDYDNDYIVKYIATYTNNTDSPITVSELGAGFYYNYNSGRRLVDMIIAREVIEPVTIPVGATRTFTITIGG